MTEEEFITRYIASQGERIETGVDEHHLSREEMIRCSVERAKDSWAILQQSIGPKQESKLDVPHEAWLERCELVNDTIFVGIPEDGDAGLSKVIFCPCGAFDGGQYVRFALFDEENGDYKLMVKDMRAEHAMSYHSTECVCMAKNYVGIDFNVLPEMRFRLPSGEEMSFLSKILVSAELSITADNDAMYMRERKIN